MNPVRIDRVQVAEKIEALVRVDDQLLRTSSRPDLAATALEWLPGLARHSCENDTGLRFVDELRDTESAHLLEHIACELMALAGSPRSLKGETSWDFVQDGHGVFRVSLQYDDDLVALGALKEGAGIVNALLQERPRPDIEVAVAELNRHRVRRPPR